MAQPSIKDVAARAGVSLGTVSNVLNRPGTVSERTREKVEAAIAELGYVRNESARHLRAGRSRTIAYVMLDAANPFFTDVARGIESVARAKGLSLFLCNSDHDVARESDYLESMMQLRVRGLLITPVSSEDRRLTSLVTAGVPVVLLDRAERDGFVGCSVSVDDIEGGDIAVSHLLELGHPRIAYVGGPFGIVQARDRLDGARRAMRRAGHDPEEIVVLTTQELTVAEGLRAGERLLGLPARRRPTAVFCANDLLALGFLQQMTMRGMAVPGDVAIVGYDDIDFAGAAAVPLTSVRQPRLELGATAARLLLEEADQPQSHEHRHIEFTPELIVRSSTSSRLSRRRGA